MTLHPGSIGGPVFRRGGKVIGVNSTSLDGMRDVSFISPIRDVVPLGVPNIIMPHELEPRTVTIRELIERNHVSLK